MTELTVVWANAPGVYFISKLYGLAPIRGCGIKEGGTFFQVRKAMQMTFQNFVILSFQIIANNYGYNNIYYYVFQNCYLSVLFNCLQAFSISVLTLCM